MKHFLTLLLLVGVSMFASAQVLRKSYFNKQWELTTRERAAYMRMSVYDTTNGYFVGPVTDMYLSGKPQMKGTYKSLKKEGDFTFFYENGNVESVGKFIDDIRAGTWAYYYPNGQRKMDVEFNPGSSIKILFLNDSTGQPLVKDGSGAWTEVYEEYNIPGKITVKGELKDYLKHGEWTCILPNGQLLYRETYKRGYFVRGSSYRNGVKTWNTTPHENTLYLPFKFLITEGFAAEDGVNFKQYPFLKSMRHGGNLYTRYTGDTTGVGKGFLPVDVPAIPPGGIDAMYKFISSVMRYPPEARGARIQGNVFVEFVIDKDGTVSGITVARGIGGGCDEEAVRIMTEYAKQFKWTPATQLGKPVEQRMVMPFKFKLG